MLSRINTNVQYVASAKNDIPIIRCWGVASEFRSTFEDYVHVAIGVDHAAMVFNIILQSNVYFGVKFLDQ